MSDNTQTIEVTTEQLFKQIFAVRKQMDPRELSSLFDNLLVRDLNGSVNVRTILLVLPLFWKHGWINEEQVQKFQDTFIDVIQQERAEHHPEVDRLPRSEINSENPDVVVVAPLQKDRTLRELAGLFKPGQEERFAQDHLKPLVLEYLYDSFANPADYQQKGLGRWVFKLLSKVVDPDNMLNGLSSTMQFNWKDDGLSSTMQFNWKDDGLDTNVSMDIFLSKKSLMKAGDSKPEQTMKIKV